MCLSLFQQYSKTVPQMLTEAQTSDSELYIFLWKSFWFSKSRRTLTFRLDKQLLRKTCHLLRNSCFWLTQSRQVTRGYKAWGERRRGHRRGDILTHQVTRVLGSHLPLWPVRTGINEPSEHDQAQQVPCRGGRFASASRWRRGWNNLEICIVFKCVISEKSRIWPPVTHFQSKLVFLAPSQSSEGKQEGSLILKMLLVFSLINSD